jgi:hypothetical protein
VFEVMKPPHAIALKLGKALPHRYAPAARGDLLHPVLDPNIANAFWQRVCNVLFSMSL